MDSKKKTALLVVSLAAVILVALVLYNSLKAKTELPGQQAVGEESKEEEEEKTKAPDFAVTDAKGKEVRLSDLLGKPVVLNFWASWCPPCKSEMPEFNKVFEELGDEVTFLMLDVVDGQRETKEKGEAYVTEQKFTFPVYYDTKQEAAYTYGVSSLPTTLFIDKDGYIVTGAKGAIDEKALRKGIAYIMKGNESPSIFLC